jgi:DNA-directed RNA polymerase sigma subunit (sigma70/sigma32)
MSPLTQKETTVLRMRFDDTQRVPPLQEVAGLLRMPLSTARRIERRALRKLRRSALGSSANGFNGWDEV